MVTPPENGQDLITGLTKKWILFLRRSISGKKSARRSKRTWSIKNIF
jgi:hypothetical protein